MAFVISLERLFWKWLTWEGMQEAWPSPGLTLGEQSPAGPAVSQCSVRLSERAGTARMLPRTSPYVHQAACGLSVVATLHKHTAQRPCVPHKRVGALELFHAHVKCGRERVRCFSVPQVVVAVAASEPALPLGHRQQRLPAQFPTVALPKHLCALLSLHSRALRCSGMPLI